MRQAILLVLEEKGGFPDKQSDFGRFEVQGSPDVATNASQKRLWFRPFVLVSVFVYWGFSSLVRLRSLGTLGAFPRHSRESNLMENDLHPMAG